MTVAQPRRQRSLTPRAFLLFLLIGGLMFSSVYPIRRYFAVRTGIEQLREEGRALDGRVDGLLAERELLSSDAEVERRARGELGMVRPGEVPFVVATPKRPVPAPAAVDPGGLVAPEEPHEASALGRWWEAFRAVFSGS